MRCWMFASSVSSSERPAASGRGSLIETGWPIASLTTRRSPGAPASRRVPRVLEARQAVPFGADHAEHLRGERAARVDAAHHRRAADAGDLQRQHLLRPARRGRPAPGRRSRCARRACAARTACSGRAAGQAAARRRAGWPAGTGRPRGRAPARRRRDRRPLRSMIVPRWRDHRFFCHLLVARGLAQRRAADDAEVGGPSGCQDQQAEEESRRSHPMRCCRALTRPPALVPGLGRSRGRPHPEGPAPVPPPAPFRHPPSEPEPVAPDPPAAAAPSWAGCDGAALVACGFGVRPEEAEPEDV